MKHLLSFIVCFLFSIGGHAISNDECNTSQYITPYWKDSEITIGFKLDEFYPSKERKINKGEESKKEEKDVIVITKGDIKHILRLFIGAFAIIVLGACFLVISLFLFGILVVGYYWLKLYKSKRA